MRLELGEIDEGELSIPHSEITKMMRRIREQNDILKQEKMHLAGSLADIAHQLRTPAHLREPHSVTAGEYPRRTGEKGNGVGGFGIGLALCKMIVTRHGGTVTAKNRLPGGAVFSIRFPK